MNKKYQWDLDDLLEKKDYETLEKKFLQNLKKMVEVYEADPFKDLESFRTFQKLSKSLSLTSNKLFNYLSNKINENLSDPKFRGLYQTLVHQTNPFQIRMANMNNVIIKNKAKILKYISEKEFAELAYSFELIFRFKLHNFSEEVEKYSSRFSPLSGSYGRLFKTLIDQELKVQDAKSSKGKLFKINNYADLMRYMKNSDRKLRESAWTNWTIAVHNYRETFAQLLYYYYLDQNISAKTRNFNGYIDSVAFLDQVPVKFISHVYDEVKKYTPLYEKYQKTTNKILKIKYKLEKVEPWDRLMSVADNNEKFTIEQAQKLAKESLAILGSEYINSVQKSFNENWIDWLPRANKVSGAYCVGGSKGLNKIYMLLNFNNKLNDVSTLVHEMGHAMHAVQFNKHQDHYAENNILFAEIASIANEVFLAYYLLKKYKNNKLKKLAVYNHLLSDFFATTTRQIIFSKFEWLANEKINSGHPFNADVAEAIYHQTNLEYTKTNLKKADFKIKNLLFKKYLTSILTIPHFYSGIFYVYKYSIGQIGALLTANKVFHGSKKELDQYYSFLQSGCSKPPLETIKILGIDLESSSPWEEVGQIVNKWIDEYVKLAEEIYKLNTTSKKKSKNPKKT